MLDLDLQLIVAQAITFAVGMLILWWIGYKPVVNLLRQRANKIKQDLDAAEKCRNDMEQAKTHYTEELAKIESKAQDMLREAVKKGQEARDELLREARSQSQDILKRAEERISEEKRKAIIELRQDVANMAFSIAEKMIGSSVDRNVQQRLVDQMLSELEKKS